MPISLPHLPHIKNKDPLLHDTLVALRNGIESLAKQAGLGTAGQITQPTIQSISVSAANGIFTVSIVDKSAAHLGVNYFIEYALNPNFTGAFTLFLGPSRDVNGWNLGNQTYYFRAFSQYQNSKPSPRVIYGGATPLGVAGGGSAPPAPAPASGSGSGPSVGPTAGGFGQGIGTRQLPNRQ